MAPGVTDRGSVAQCIRFWEQKSKKSGIKEFNDLQTPKVSKKQRCDRTLRTLPAALWMDCVRIVSAVLNPLHDCGV